MPDEHAAREAVRDGDRWVFEAIVHEDLALANACAEVERGLRQDALRAVERLGALVAYEVGEVDDRIRSLDGNLHTDALSAAYGAFWIY